MIVKKLKIIKKVVISSMVTLWLVLIFKIYQTGGNMNEQLPKCIFTTMIIFGILTLVVSLIDKKIGNDIDN